MNNKTMTPERYAEELSILAEHIRTSGFQRYWEGRCDYQRWSCNDAYWEIVTGLPPLIAAAAAYDRPSEGGGKWIYTLVSPELMERIFGEELDRFVEQMREMMNRDIDRWYAHEMRRVEEYEDRILAYHRLDEFVGLLKAAGVSEYRTRLTDHGMSAAEVKRLEEFIAEESARIDGIRNPAPKPLLF